LNDELTKKESERPFSPRREKALLKMIGALLAMRYTKDKYFKSSGQVNVSAIADQFDIDLATIGFCDDGLKADTIRKTIIGPALEAIAENKREK
jgi:hypothetical protein